MFDKKKHTLKVVMFKQTLYLKAPKMPLSTTKKAEFTTKKERVCCACALLI